MRNDSFINNIRTINEEVPNIFPEFGRKHPDLIYNGAPEDYEDLADLEPCRIVRGEVIA